jgi:hypothetical protein
VFIMKCADGRTRRIVASAGALSIALLLAAACSDDDACEGGCGDPDAIGVPLSPVCGGEVCTAGVICDGEIVAAATQAELDEAAAKAGACVALLPGKYGDVTLAEGTSLLGRWADEVEVGEVSVAGGDVVIRGVEAKGIRVDGGAARVDQTRVTGGTGIVGKPGSDLELVQVEVTAVAEQGAPAVLADGVGQLSLDRVFVHRNGGPGVFVQADGCDGTLAQVALERVHVEETVGVGMALIGASATIRSTEILRTSQTPGEADGFGLGTSSCSELDVEGLRVDDTANVAVVLFESSGSLGSPGEDRGIIIVNGRGGGVWLESATAELELDNFDISDSGGVGIGVGPETVGIIIVNGRVANTSSAARPVVGGDMRQVGDGLLWGGDSQIVMDDVTLEGSSRNAVLIDGPVAAGSSIANITLGGDDADKGILQQRVSTGEDAPAVDNAPAVDQTEEAMFEVPVSPAFQVVE